MINKKNESQQFSGTLKMSSDTSGNLYIDEEGSIYDIDF